MPPGDWRSCYACFFQKNDYICSMLTFVAILGFVMLIGAALNEVRHSKNHISKVIAGVLIVLLLFILLF